MESALEFLGPDSVMKIPFVKEHIAQMIFEDCGTYKTNEVVQCYGKIRTAHDIKKKIRNCCKNARGGEVIMRKDGTTYKVPTINERAACSLLDLLIERGAWSGELLNNVQKMRTKMRGPSSSNRK
jgi:hypothetical protein